MRNPHWIAAAWSAAIFSMLLAVPVSQGKAAETPDAVPADPRRELMAKVHLPGMQITAVETRAPGTFAGISDLPSFCRVAATLRPSADSNIRIELWLPRENWNGRLLGTGNGGGAGAISYKSLGLGLRRGFAAVNTDLGTSPNADAMTAHPERWADFGHRATHEMTVAAKALVAAFYGQPARRAYFVAGSTGGQQALVEAQSFPEDYDGILAGAPANNRTHLHDLFLWNWQAVQATPEKGFAPEQLAAIARAVVAAVGGRDGGAPGDNFLTDPRLCFIDPEKLPDLGLSAAQLTALKKIYAGPTNPRTGERIYAPNPPGSEEHAPLIAIQKPSSAPTAYYYPFWWAFGAGYDRTRFDFDRDVDAMDRRLAPILNANSPDLSALRRRGGKLLMYTGTADAVVPFQDAVNYYERVVEAQGGLRRTQEFFRYFLVPGMGHVVGGPGLNLFGQMLDFDVPQDPEHNALLALEKWVEQGIAPDQIIATAFHDADPAKRIRFQRPIYPYPKFPHYKGGDVASPDSYDGVDHERGGVLKPAPRYLN